MDDLNPQMPLEGEMRDLLSCPFCGGKPRLAFNGMRAQCGYTATDARHSLVSLPLEVWNRHTPSPPREVTREDVEAALIVNLFPNIKRTGNGTVHSVGGIDDATNAILALLQPTKQEGGGAQFAVYQELSPRPTPASYEEPPEPSVPGAWEPATALAQVAELRAALEPGLFTRAIAESDGVDWLGENHMTQPDVEAYMRRGEACLAVARSALAPQGEGRS